MPERDGTAIDVDASRIEPELGDDGEALRGEGFVDLPQVDVGDRPAGLSGVASSSSIRTLASRRTPKLTIYVTPPPKAYVIGERG